MICPGCFRDVPDLIGPGTGLCPACYGVSAEELVPSHLAAHHPAGLKWSHAFFEVFAEDFAAFLCDLDELEDLDGIDAPAESPTFQGKPRF